MFNRIIWLLLGFPAVLLMVTLAVINRHYVPLVLDPFRPEQPAVALSMPFYFYLFGMLVLGALIGGAVVWFSQGHWRRRARNRAQEAARWQVEAERLARERDTELTGRKQLTVASR